ncbi:16587_t:CDS:2, partial [Gigaspora margarita]
TSGSNILAPLMPPMPISTDKRKKEWVLIDKENDELETRKIVKKLEKVTRPFLKKIFEIWNGTNWRLTKLILALEPEEKNSKLDWQKENQDSQKRRSFSKRNKVTKNMERYYFELDRQPVLETLVKSDNKGSIKENENLKQEEAKLSLETVLKDLADADLKLLKNWILEITKSKKFKP